MKNIIINSIDISRRDLLKVILSSATAVSLPSACQSVITSYSKSETNAGWQKYVKNPVLGGDYGTCFDPFVIKENEKYQMWFSWRPFDSIAYVESFDGVNWTSPSIVLSPNLDSGWENRVNRASIVKNNYGYHMWYTGQTDINSYVGYAISNNGINWDRVSTNPVIRPEFDWEKKAVMCPHVIFDENESQYRMWYSGGEQFEPDAIGYAVSHDGINWEKQHNNPIFTPNLNNKWERNKVTACYVLHQNNIYYMFYIGFMNPHYAQIGIARSVNGISDWQRHPDNPIISPGIRTWDRDSVYKPSVIFECGTWKLWYNGRRKFKEQIGLAFHFGKDLGFL